MVGYKTPGDFAGIRGLCIFSCHQLLRPHRCFGDWESFNRPVVLEALGWVCGGAPDGFGEWGVAEAAGAGGVDEVDPAVG